MSWTNSSGISHAILFAYEISIPINNMALNAVRKGISSEVIHYNIVVGIFGPLHVLWQVAFGCWVTWSISSWQKYDNSAFLCKGEWWVAKCVYFSTLEFFEWNLSKEDLLLHQSLSLNKIWSKIIHNSQRYAAFVGNGCFYRAWKGTLISKCFELYFS